MERMICWRLFVRLARSLFKRDHRILSTLQCDEYRQARRAAWRMNTDSGSGF